MFESLSIGLDRLRTSGLEAALEIEAFLRREGIEQPLQVDQQPFERNGLDMHVHAARFDLRKVQDVVDQREQVVSGRLNRFGVFDLLRRQVALGIVRQQFGENQRGVERRAQLVRHVGQEVGLVSAGLSEFLRLFVEQGVRALCRVALVFEQLGLLLQIRVDLLELGLLAFEPCL